MTPEQFLQQMLNGKNHIQSLVQTKLPRMIGKNAVDHFKENFRKGGFVNNGLQAWKKSNRIDETGKYAASKYGPLLSARKELYNSISFIAGNSTVTILSDKEYAQIHNEGGITHPTVTDKMKKFAWYKHKETKQKSSMWMGIALKPVGSKLNVKIEKRQFIGNSKELDVKIENIIESELTKIFNL